MHRLLQPTAALLAALAPWATAQEPPLQGPLSMTIHFGNRPAAEEDCQVAKWGPRGLPSPLYAFRVGKLLTSAGAPITDGVVLTRNGLVVAVGPAAQVEIPEDATVIHEPDMWATPGLIDLHCHTAGASSDINDSVFPNNPEFRTLDLITLDHDKVKDALAGGVTTVLYIPGSGSNTGGFGTLTKTAGSSPEEALVRFPGSLKIAQADNPTRRAGDLGATRAGMNVGLRFMLERARAYHEAWEAWSRGEGPKPEKEADLEYLRGLFRHEYPLSVHTQAYQVVLATITELRGEFGLWTVIVHGTMTAYPLSGYAFESGVPVCNGPRQYHFDTETGSFIGLADTWYRGGRFRFLAEQKGLGRDGIAINTDSPVVPQNQLTLQCAMAVRLGLPHEVGILGLTINPARMVGIDHRVGTLEPGKDADLVLWSGDPIDPRSYVSMSVVNGKIAYRRNPRRPRW